MSRTQRLRRTLVTIDRTCFAHLIAKVNVGAETEDQLIFAPPFEKAPVQEIEPEDLIQALSHIPGWEVYGDWQSGIILVRKSEIDKLRPEGLSLIVEEVLSAEESQRFEEPRYRCRRWLNETKGYDTKSEIYCCTVTEIVCAIAKLITQAEVVDSIDIKSGTI